MKITLLLLVLACALLQYSSTSPVPKRGSNRGICKGRKNIKTCYCKNGLEVDSPRKCRNKDGVAKCECEDGEYWIPKCAEHEGFMKGSCRFDKEAKQVTCKCNDGTEFTKKKGKGKGGNKAGKKGGKRGKGGNGGGKGNKGSPAI